MLDRYAKKTKGEKLKSTDPSQSYHRILYELETEC